VNPDLRRVFTPRAAKVLITVVAYAWIAFGPGSSLTRAQGASGNAPARSYTVGGTSIAIPAPPRQSMVELGNNRGVFDPAVPDSNRLVAAFVQQKDVAALQSKTLTALTQYALVEAMRSSESTNVSEDEFKSDVAEVAKEMNSVMDSSFKEGQDAFNKRMKAMNLNVQVTYGKPVSLGAFFSEPNAYAFGMMAPVSTNGKTTNMIVATVLVRARSRIFFAYYFAAYQNEQTPGQARAISQQWADAILAANK
jgi:hypothetical protein